MSAALGYRFCLLSHPGYPLVIHAVCQRIIFIAAVKGNERVFVIEVHGVGAAALINRKGLVIAEIIIDFSEFCRIDIGAGSVVVIAVDNINLLARFLFKVSEFLSQIQVVLNEFPAVCCKVSGNEDEIAAVILFTLAQEFVNYKSAFMLICASVLV